jgi:hypothetical protein
MSGTPAEERVRFWNERYEANPALYGEAPNVFLVSVRDRLPATGRAFVPGDGQGRNGLWLAREGFSVLSVDLADAAVASARARAEAEDLPLEAVAGDLKDVPIEEGAFDVVVAIYLHFVPKLRPVLHGRFERALKPGGLVVLEAFSPEQLALRQIHGSGGPPRADMLYDEAMLDADFAGCERVFAERREVTLAEGEGHSGPAAVVRGLWRRKRAP